MTLDVTAGEYAAGQKCKGTREAIMRQAQVQSGIIVGWFLLVVMTGTGLKGGEQELLHERSESRHRW